MTPYYRLRKYNTGMQFPLADATNALFFHVFKFHSRLITHWWMPISQKRVPSAVFFVSFCGVSLNNLILYFSRMNLHLNRTLRRICAQICRHKIIFSLQYSTGYRGFRADIHGGVDRKEQSDITQANYTIYSSSNNDSI